MELGEGGGAGYLGVQLPEQEGDGKKGKAKHSSSLLRPQTLPFPICKVEALVFAAANVERRSQEVTGLGCPGSSHGLTQGPAAA